MKKLIIVIIISISLVSCITQLKSESDLAVDFEFIDSPISQMNRSSMQKMDGLFFVMYGSEILGDKVVGKWIGNRWCLYSLRDAIYSENAGGVSGDSIRFSGYIRTIRSAQGKRVKFRIPSNAGARELLKDQFPDNFKIYGMTEDGDRIELTRIGDLYNSQFQIIAHRGGGRNSDRLGISENSIEMIQHAAILGATGIEIDIKRTRDNELILFHDDTFSPRTVQGSYLLGKVENFDLNQIKMFGRLVNGEKIPTLMEALKCVVDKTTLNLVWLDIKDPATVDKAIQIQKDAELYAASKGSNLQILFGIPSEEILTAYRNSPLANTNDILIELDYKTALGFSNCKVWAPRWTNSIPQSEINSMRNSGKLVFTWTVDLREIMIEYLGKLDGILSNYPSLVSALHDSK